MHCNDSKRQILRTYRSLHRVCLYIVKSNVFTIYGKNYSHSTKLFTNNACFGMVNTTKLHVFPIKYTAQICTWNKIFIDFGEAPASISICQYFYYHFLCDTFHCTWCSSYLNQHITHLLSFHSRFPKTHMAGKGGNVRICIQALLLYQT